MQYLPKLYMDCDIDLFFGTKQELTSIIFSDIKKVPFWKEKKNSMSLAVFTLILQTPISMC